MMLNITPCGNKFKIISINEFLKNNIITKTVNKDDIFIKDGNEIVYINIDLKKMNYVWWDNSSNIWRDQCYGIDKYKKDDDLIFKCEVIIIQSEKKQNNNIMIIGYINNVIL